MFPQLKDVRNCSHVRFDPGLSAPLGGGGVAGGSCAASGTCQQVSWREARLLVQTLPLRGPPVAPGGPHHLPVALASPDLYCWSSSPMACFSVGVLPPSRCISSRASR